VDAKILGVVFNCTSEGGNRYGYRYGGKYNKRYYRRYYKKYGSAYEDAANKRKPDFKEWKN
jgi:hypothetical protein